MLFTTRKDNKKIAIEIETGKSDFLRNLRQNLLAHYDKIIIVTTNPAAFNKIERSLAGAGLLMPVKIELVFRGLGLTMD